MFLAVCPNPAIDSYLWVDSLDPAQVHRVKRERRFPGGKGVHVALALAELGESVKLLGFWGGATGIWIRERCEERGIHCEGPEIEDWNRSCITFKSQSKYDETELLGLGPTVLPRSLQEFMEIYSSLIGDCSGVSFSGSLANGLADSFYADLIKSARQKKLFTYLDCTGKPLIKAMEQKPYCIHLNERECAEYSGGSDLLSMVEDFRKHTALPAITAGKEGLYLGTQEGTYHGSVQIEKVVSAVGAGDCLLAGIAAAKLRDYTMEDTVRLAVACGAANCLSEDLGMFVKKDVDRLFAEVKVKKL